MTSDLAEEEAEAYVHGVCFKTGPPERIGVETEWLVQDRRDSELPISLDRLSAALAPVEEAGALPGGSRITREPGGQVELSSPPAPSPTVCVEAMAADLTALREAVEGAGLILVGQGLDPCREEPPRILGHPRYRAMEKYFDREGPSGRVMMRRTASVQINLDSGDESGTVRGYRHRWELAHRIGPVLVAAFANSPIVDGRPSGWLSTRQAVWSRMDAGRTRQPQYHHDPRVAWTRYALDAKVMCIPGGDNGDWSAPPDLTFRDWLRGTPGLRRPAQADLEYHLSTLFPPVRPRGWLELRMTDAQTGDDWIVPTVLAATLLDDPAAADAAYAATEPLCQGTRPVPSDDVWQRAARIGLADPDLAKAARACFAAADGALARPGASAALRQALADFAERYAERGRSPAHDRLDALRCT
ncbi:ergothioneine biosynthesis glutamate--cysteine ligase EgtA [Streptomyces sp. NPDC059582]|uniref:ergothioneine biosynthesis glutamate--cysteine ligase EgtA n=1 Tax=Streptomyces sp. NPDC059582 TaxID=3346875 RepID=UPI003678E9A2